MRSIKHIEFYVGLIGASAVFLGLEQVSHWEFFWHLAAVPLEILAAVFIVERFLENREIREKRRHLMYIKSTMFRSEMRDLFLAGFAALESPAATMTDIRAAGLEELRELRKRAEAVEFRSLEAMEPVILEYVRAKHVWHDFKERAISYNFENIFMDMIEILNFITDVEHFREKYPGRMFVQAAAEREDLMAKTRKILGNGVRSFLDYVIELKEKNPVMFEELLADYELSARLRDAPPAPD